MRADRPRAPAARSGPRFAAAAHKVRIIGGRFKRTPLPVADLPGLRPTPDRVRETLFNWLAHLRPQFESLRGLDLFAGTGALGFELASRGARAVTLVEREPKLVAQLEQLKARLNATEVEVVRGDALAVASRLPPAAFDLVFIDPPYDAGLQVPALAAVGPLLAPAALVYLEAAEPVTPELLGGRYVALRQMKAGQVHAHLLQARQEP